MHRRESETISNTSRHCYNTCSVADPGISLSLSLSLSLSPGHALARPDNVIDRTAQGAGEEIRQMSTGRNGRLRRLNKSSTPCQWQHLRLSRYLSTSGQIHGKVSSKFNE